MSVRRAKASKRLLDFAYDHFSRAAKIALLRPFTFGSVQKSNR